MGPGIPLRFVAARASALGGVATTVGTIGHVEAGGSNPNLVVLGLVWLCASLLSAAFMTKRIGLVRIAALLLSEQVLVHVSLMTFVGMPISSFMPGMPGMPGMATMPPMASTVPHMSVVPSMGMLTAHAVAAIVAGLWLWRGECALWSLLMRARAALTVRWFASTTSGVVPDLRIEADSLPVWSIRIAREMPRRGPPRLSAL